MRAFVAWHRQRHLADLLLIDAYFDANALLRDEADASLSALPRPGHRPGARGGRRWPRPDFRLRAHAPGYQRAADRGTVTLREPPLPPVRAVLRAARHAARLARVHGAVVVEPLRPRRPSDHRASYARVSRRVGSRGRWPAGRGPRRRGRRADPAPGCP